jgi:DNA topoisomerase-1
MVDFELDAAHPAHRVKIEGMIRGLCARYPRVPLKAVRIYQPEPDDRSMGNADEDGVISFNGFWFSQDPQVLEDAAVEDFIVPVAGKMMGWHGAMIDEPEHVIAHEFGHFAIQSLPELKQWAEELWQELTEDPAKAPAGYALAGPDECGAEVFAEHVLLGGGGAAVDDFVEREHPRGGSENPGQFVSKGGGTIAAVSPNIGELSFGEAVKALNTSRHQALHKVVQSINEKLEIKGGEVKDVIGAWADGAEDSLLIEMPTSDFAKARAAAAMEGWLADQKAVLVFQPGGPNGQYFAKFNVDGDVADIHDGLLQDGLEFHTLEPTRTGAVVHILAMDQDTVDTITKAARKRGASVEVMSGHGEFVGTTKETGSDREQRDDARRIYDEVIAEAQASRGLGGQDFPKFWQDLRRDWGAQSKAEALDDFKESAISRQGKGSPEGGQFVSKGGGGRGATSAMHPAPADRAAWPAHIKALKVPPAWTNVQISHDPKAPLQATGKDVKGRAQYVYHPDFAKSQSAAKFERVKQLLAKQQQVASDIEKAQRSSSAVEREHATVAALIFALGLRPGSEKETGAEEQAYGATTLEARHVVRSGDKVRLKFTGKKGVKLDIPVEDKKLAGELVRRAAHGGKLFPGVSDGSLRAFVAHLDGGGFKTKDFRTALAATIANDIVSKIRPPRSEREYKMRLKQVATEVSKKLGNTPAVALSSYIPPVLFAPWREKLGMAEDAASTPESRSAAAKKAWLSRQRAKPKPPSTPQQKAVPPGSTSSAKSAQTSTPAPQSTPPAANSDDWWASMGKTAAQERVPPSPPTSGPPRTPAQAQSLDRYINDPDDINNFLKKGQRPDDPIAITDAKVIQQAFRPTTQPVELFRGQQKGWAAMYANLKPGDRLTRPGFTSTSRSLKQALEFAGRTARERGYDMPDRAIVHIHAPKGTPMIGVAAAAGARHDVEKEELLQHGSNFRVEKIDPESHQIWLRVDSGVAHDAELPRIMWDDPTETETSAAA